MSDEIEQYRATMPAALVRSYTNMAVAQIEAMSRLPQRAPAVRTPVRLGGRFGFEVGAYQRTAADHPEFVVRLPGQEVALALSRSQAIAETERFVAEAQIALAKLRECPE